MLSYTENFWNTVSKVDYTIDDDQRKINDALVQMNLNWTVADNWMGRSPSGFTLTILPHKYMCRLGECKMKEKSYYYVWHHGGGLNSKVARAQSDHVWFLVKDWLQIAKKNTAVGVEWLRKIKLRK